MEQKAMTTEIKADATTGTFEGYASAFGTVDSYGDVVQKGSFLKTIQERRNKIKVLYNHDANGLPIGTPVDLREDDYGLHVVARFSNTTFAQDVRTLMQEGAINTMSIGFTTIKQMWAEEDGEPRRYLQELKLFEFSPVLFEANPDAVITGSKSIDHIARTITQLEDLIAVGIKSGRPLSAENLTRLQTAYTQFHALLQAKGEPQPHSPRPEAATQDAEPQTHSDDLLPALKSFTFAPQQTPDEAAVMAEVKRAFAFIHTGVAQ